MFVLFVSSWNKLREKFVEYCYTLFITLADCGLVEKKRTEKVEDTSSRALNHKANNKMKWMSRTRKKINCFFYLWKNFCVNWMYKVITDRYGYLLSFLIAAADITINSRFFWRINTWLFTCFEQTTDNVVFLCEWKAKWTMHRYSMEGSTSKIFMPVSSSRPFIIG